MRRLRQISAILATAVLTIVAFTAAPANAVDDPLCKLGRITKLPSGGGMSTDCLNKVWSANGLYLLILQPADGNLVFYRLTTAGDSSSANKVLWSWKGGGTNAKLRMVEDGRLVYSGAVTRVSRGPHVANAWLKVQDDGKLVIYSEADQPLSQFCIVEDSSGRSYNFCPV